VPVSSKKNTSKKKVVPVKRAKAQRSAMPASKKIKIVKKAVKRSIPAKKVTRTAFVPIKMQKTAASAAPKKPVRATVQKKSASIKKSRIWIKVPDKKPAPGKKLIIQGKTAEKKPALVIQPKGKINTTAKKTIVKQIVKPALPVQPQKVQAKKTGEQKLFAPFTVSKAVAAGPRYFFCTEIPDTYNDTYMCALPRDPLWLYVYWEVSAETTEIMRRHVGAEAYAVSKWVLRVLDVTDIVYDGTNAWRQMDIDLPPYASNWYVKVWEPARSFMVQCGIVTADGKFFPAVTSNSVRMPRMGVSAVLDEEWMTESTDELIRLSGVGLKRGLGASENSSEFSVGGLASGSGSGSIL
jgi:hypothetical protein